ncbi:MAG TPA: hypothetical protein VGK73_08200 [Polyangiaceae bacterium]
MRLVWIAALVALGCSTYREDLNRGQRLYEENQYEHALAIWRVLEADADSLSINDQARYAYLRGMTDYRLGFRPYARHWLGIARAIDKEHPGGLNQEWRDRLDKSLADLDKDVYGGSERFDKTQPGFVEKTETSPSDTPPPASTAPPSPPPGH